MGLIKNTSRISESILICQRRSELKPFSEVQVPALLPAEFAKLQKLTKKNPLVILEGEFPLAKARGYVYISIHKSEFVAPIEAVAPIEVVKDLKSQTQIEVELKDDPLSELRALVNSPNPIEVLVDTHTRRELLAYIKIFKGEIKGAKPILASRIIEWINQGL